MTPQKRSRATVQDWVISAVAAHKIWPQFWRKGYAGMLEVGFKLIRGKEACPDLVDPPDAESSTIKCPHQAKGRCYLCNLLMASSAVWDLTLKKEAPELRQTTVGCYMDLSRDALMWTSDMHPQVTDRTKQEAIATTVMIMSPRPFVALLRNLQQMRPFGEYDAVKYRDSKRLGNGEQLELNFEKLMASFDVMDRDDVVLKVPEGKDEAEAWAEIVQRCERLVTIGKGKMGKGTIDV